MGDVRISKSYSFDSAHMLPGHKGKCSRLHGHTYHLTVWLKGPTKDLPGVSDDGMVMDYADVDACVKPIVDHMDHRFLARGNEWPYKLYLLYDWFMTRILSTDQFQFLTGLELPKPSEIGEQFFMIQVRTTAENLAKWFWQRVASELYQFDGFLMGIVVSETEKTTAEYIWTIGTPVDEDLFRQ